MLLLSAPPGGDFPVKREGCKERWRFRFSRATDQQAEEVVDAVSIFFSDGLLLGCMAGARHPCIIIAEYYAWRVRDR